jgi:hypothetical protein
MAGIHSSIARIPRGLACDLLVFLANFFLAVPMKEWLDRGVRSFHENEIGAPPVLGGILAGAMALYALGCWLKRGPLHSRRNDAPDSGGCLLVLWISLMFSLTILGTTLVMVEANGDAESGWQMALLFAVALVPVVSGARMMIAEDVSRLPKWRTRASMELVADSLIVASILPATLLWQDGISGIFARNLAGSDWGMRLFAAGLAMAAFAVFYWAPRLVLVWDRIHDRWTWATFVIAATPTLRACLFP